MSKTPKRNSLSTNCGFSRVILPESPAASPQKNLTGPPRVAKDIVADVYNNVQLWNTQILIGAELVKKIAVNASNNFHRYNLELEELVNKLYKIVETLSKCRDAFQSYSHQLKSLTNLWPQAKPLFISMKVEDMASSILDIFMAYNKEFDMKEYILENIAHTGNKDEVMFLAAAWMYQCNISRLVDMKLEALLLETGHRKIT